MITLKPYPIESRSNRKEFPDISRGDPTTSETFMRAFSSCFHPGSVWHERRGSGRIDRRDRGIIAQVIPDCSILEGLQDGVMTSPGGNVERAFASAKEQYAEWGVDVDAALTRLATIAISLHCWQGDDVGGFENTGQELGGGLAVTGHYPGKARTPDELRSDLDKTLTLLPGSHRLNLHASYAETGGRKVERDALEPEHFQRWIDWAKSRHIGMDFNPTYFAHPLAADGYTLAHRRQGHPPVLDRSWDRLPAHRRGDRQGPGNPLRDQRLDS